MFLAFAPESEQQVKNVLANHPLEYTIIPNAKAYYEQLGIDGYPKNFFIDQKGTIVQVTDGTRFIYDAQSRGRKPDNFRFYDQIMSAMK